MYIERRNVLKGKHDDMDDFAGTPTAPASGLHSQTLLYQVILKIYLQLLFPKKDHIEKE